MLVDLRKLWPSLPSGAELQAALRYQLLPAVVNDYGDAAASLSADWYDTLRASLGVGGRFSAQLADPPAEDMLRAVSNWVAANPETALARAEAATQKIVADMARRTVTVSAEKDPRAHGWARFTDNGACAFCRMLANRGGVYTSASVKFGSHNHCHCLAGPVWSENQQWVGRYKQADRSDTAKDSQNRLARQWIKDNLPGVRG